MSRTSARPASGRRIGDPLVERLGAFLEALSSPVHEASTWEGAARALAGVPGLLALFVVAGGRDQAEVHPVGGPLPEGVGAALACALGPLRAEPRAPGVPRQVVLTPAVRALLFWGGGDGVEGPELLGGLLLEPDTPLASSTDLGPWLAYFELAMGRGLCELRLADYREALDLMNLLQPPVLGPERGLVEEVLARLRRLSGADAAALAWLDREGGAAVTWLLPAGLDPARRSEARERLAFWLPEVGSFAESERIDVRGPPARPGPLGQSELVLPLLGPGGSDRGRLALLAGREGVFGHHVLTLIGSLAPALAGALDRLADQVSLRDRAAHLERENARVDAQLELARRVQGQLAAPCPPTPKGLVVAEQGLQSAQIGGDFFAARAFGARRYGVAIADVSGKGLPAGLLMAHTRGALLAAWESTTDPAAVLDRLNRVVYDSTDDYLFVTMLIVLVDVGRRQASFASAGHEPLRRLPAAGALEEHTSGDPPLGILDGLTYRRHAVPFVPGDALVLLTDGCHEERSPAGERFGRGRLDALLAEVGPRPGELVARVMAGLSAWRGGGPPADDATCLALGRVVP